MARSRVVQVKSRKAKPQGYGSKHERRSKKGLGSRSRSKNVPTKQNNDHRKRRVENDKRLKSSKPVKKVKFDLESNNVIDIPIDRSKDYSDQDSDEEGDSDEPCTDEEDNGDQDFGEEDSDNPDVDVEDSDNSDADEEESDNQDTDEKALKNINGTKDISIGLDASTQPVNTRLEKQKRKDTTLTKESGATKTKYRDKKNECLTEDYKKSIEIYEKLQKKKLAIPKRVALVSSFIDAAKGNIAKYLFRRRFCRAFECAIKYGSKEQKTELSCEIQNLFVELPKTVYGKHVMIRIIHNCGADVRNKILKCFAGHVPKFIRHSTASLVLEELYAYSNSTQRKKLFMELYGPEYALLGNQVVHTLDEILKDDEAKKKYILKSMKEIITSILSKPNIQIEKLSMAHKLLLEYIEHVDKKDEEDLIGLTKDRLVSILHTDSGIQFACRCLSIASIKVKKEIVGTFKSHIRSIARDSSAHLILIASMCCINDVKFLKKYIFEEFFDSSKDEETNNADMFRDKYATRVVAFMLSGTNKPFPRFLVGVIQGKLNEFYINLESGYPSEKRYEILDAVQQLLSSVICDNMPILIRDSRASGIVLSAVYNLGNPMPIIDSISKLLHESLDSEQPDVKDFHAVKKLSKQINESAYMSQGIDLSQHVTLNFFSARVIRGVICAERLLKLLDYPQASIDRAKVNAEKFINMISEKMIDLIPTILEKCISTPPNIHHTSLLILYFLENCDKCTLTKVNALIPRELISSDEPLTTYISKNILRTSRKKMTTSTKNREINSKNLV